MKENLAVGVFTLVFVLCIGVIATQMQPPAPETTPRLLDSDPDFFAGKNVRVRTGGLETVGAELHFRKTTDQPPCVVLRFRDKPPEKLPAVLTGLCHGRVGGVVLITDCH